MKKPCTQEISLLAQMLEGSTKYLRPVTSEMLESNVLRYSHSSASPVDDVERFIESSHHTDKQSRKSSHFQRSVLALRWSEIYGTVRIVDLLTGTVKAGAHPNPST